MIKINLATRKQAVASGASGDMKATAKAAGAALGKLSLDAETLKALPIKRLLVPFVIGYIASYGLDTYKTDEVKKVEDVISKLKAEETKLQLDLAKTKNYEEVKKSLDADEFTIRTKIETIQKLVSDRQVASKVLMSLSGAIPAEVWLSTLKIESSDVSVRGFSMGFNQVSDFMKNLTESIYFKDVKLTSTQQTKDDASGMDIPTFELSAKRR